MQSYYGWVCRCSRQLENTTCGRNMAGFVIVYSKETQCVVVLWLGLLLLSSVSKHSMWSYYGWVCCCFSQPVSTICGRIMVGFLVVVRQ
jgi:hypothetical protein